MKRLVLLFFILPGFFAYVFPQSHEGTEFWLGYMEHVDQNQNTKVVMISSETNTQGVVEMPNANWSQAFTVSAGDVSIVTLPTFAETFGSEKIDKTGIRVTSDDPVVVYSHQYHNARSEASLILPTQALGEEYYVVTYTGFTDSRGTHHPSEMLIVAIEDQTEIEIQLVDETVGGRQKGDVIQVTLARGQSYQVQAKDGSSGDQTGTYVQSNKKIAVFGGASWTKVNIGCEFRDNLYEQMFPIQSWGKRFIMAPFKDTNYDVYRVIASENNTQVFRDNLFLATLDKGQFLERTINNDPIYITGDKPILIAQYTVGETCNSQAPEGIGDPSMLLLSSVEQNRDKVTLYSSPFENIEQNYVNIIARTDDFDDIYFDGVLVNTLGEPIVPVAALPDFSYVSLRVTDGQHRIESEGCGVTASAYGFGEVESYAYSAGASFKNLEGSPIPDGGCLNDTIIFDTGIPSQLVEAFWDFGDGTTSTQPQVIHFYQSLGEYDVTLITHDLCFDTYDTLQKRILVSLRKAVDTGQDMEACEGEQVELTASDLAGSTYLWKGPDTYASTQQNPILIDLIPANSGTYQVIATFQGCATFPAFTLVEVHKPEPILGNDTSLCFSEGEQLLLQPGAFASYLWNNGTKQFSVEVQKEGTYFVEVKDNIGCVGADTILIEEKCPTAIYFPNAFSPNDDGKNDFFKIIAADVENYRLLIYNRWGGLMFTSAEPDQGWDGTYNGKSVPQGVYVWRVMYDGYSKDREDYHFERTGTVTLIR